MCLLDDHLVKTHWLLHAAELKGDQGQIIKEETKS